jgi:hypothetical protein
MTPWSRISNDHGDHPKIVAAGWIGELLHIRSIGHCSQFLTDGFVDAAMVPRLLSGVMDTFRALGRDPQIVAAIDLVVAAVAETDWGAHMVKCRLWDRVPGGGYRVHNYLKYQPSKSEVEKLTAKKQKAGRKGAKERWGKSDSKVKPAMADEVADAIAGAIGPAMPGAIAERWQAIGGGESKAGGECESKPEAPVIDNNLPKGQQVNARASRSAMTPSTVEQVAIIKAEFASEHPDWPDAQLDEAAEIEYRRRHAQPDSLAPIDPVADLNAKIERLIAADPRLSRTQAHELLMKQQRRQDQRAQQHTPTQGGPR